LKEWFWKLRFSEYALLGLMSALLTLVTLAVFLGLTILRLLGFPGITPSLVLLATIVVSILGPMVLGRTMTRSINADAPDDGRITYTLEVGR
jgi:hypothetical protein